MEEPSNGMAVDGSRGKRKQQPEQKKEAWQPHDCAHHGRYASAAVGAPRNANSRAAGASDGRDWEGGQGDGGRYQLPDRTCEERSAERNAGRAQCQRRSHREAAGEPGPDGEAACGPGESRAIRQQQVQTLGMAAHKPLSLEAGPGTRPRWTSCQM